MKTTKTMKKVKGWNTIGFTEPCFNLIKGYATFNHLSEKQETDLCIELIEYVANIPKKHEIDSMDDFARFTGVPLSFIKDWKTKEMYIMLTDEAKALDSESGVRA